MRKNSIFVIFFYFLLPLQSASATVWEYSISGNVVFSEDDSMEIIGTAFIDDTKTPFYDPEDLPFNCQLAPASNDCIVKFDITYFEMSVGGEYSFAGTSGFLEFNSADALGALYGTGDFSSLRWTANAPDAIYEPPYYAAENYEQWLAFDLPTYFVADEPFGGLEITNPDFPEWNGFYNATFEQVVPVPAAVWLFGSGLLGLIGIAKRKKSSLDKA